MHLKFPTHYDRTIELPIADPLVIRLNEDIGPLRAGLLCSLPAYEATRLVRRRMATVVGTLGVMADLTLTEDELAEVAL